MQTSIFLAKLLGPIWLVLGIALATHRATYAAMAVEWVESRPLVYLAGVVALAIGLALVLTHNVWVADWRVIITLFGWMATLAGVVRLMFPMGVERAGRTMLKTETPILITGIVWMALGAVLCIVGYFR